MTITYGPRFLRDYANLESAIQRRVDKQLKLLLENPRHHSLRIHKMGGYPNVFEARVTKGYRFTFSVLANTYFLRRVGTHDILKKP